MFSKYTFFVQNFVSKMAEAIPKGSGKKRVAVTVLTIGGSNK